MQQKRISEAFLGSLILCISILPGFSTKPTGDALIDLNQKPPLSESEDHEAAILLLNLSHSTSSPEQLKKHENNIGEFSKAKRGRKRKNSGEIAMSPEEKRNRHADYQRLRQQSIKEEYANRFQHPSDSEQRKKIEKEYEERTERKRKYRTQWNKAQYERIRTGNGTIGDMKIYEIRKKSSLEAQKKRNQRIKEGNATENDLSLHFRQKESRKRYRQRKKDKQNVLNYTYRKRKKLRQKQE